MTPNDDKISPIQQGVFQFLTMLGVGIIILPSALVKEAKNDSWIFCAGFGLLNIIIVYIISRLVQKYKGDGFVKSLKKLFGNFLGIVFAIPTFIFFLFVVSTEIRLFADTTKLYLLNKTPLEFIILPLIIAVIVLVRGGIEPITRFFEVVFPILVIVAVMFIIQTLPKSDYSNLRPFFKSGLGNITNLYSITLYAYSGYELLIIIAPFLRKPEKTFKVSYLVILMVTFIYTFLVIQCIARFGVKETGYLLYPVVSLVKASDVYGSFVERTEGLLMAMWVIFAFAKVVSYTYAYSLVIGDLVGHKEKKHFASLLLPIIYLMSLQGENIADVFNIINKVTLILGTYTIIILPLLMFIVSFLKRRKGDDKNEG